MRIYSEGYRISLGVSKNVTRIIAAQINVELQSCVHGNNVYVTRELAGSILSTRPGD